MIFLYCFSLCCKRREHDKCDVGMKNSRDLFSQAIIKCVVEYFVIIALLFSGIISFYAVFTDNRILKLWKELYICLFVLFAILFCKKKYSMKLIISSSVILITYILVIVYNLSINNYPILIEYQIKNDFIPLIFAALFYAVISTYSYNMVYLYASKLIRIIIFCGAINALIGLLQTLFPFEFLDLLGFDGNWGESTE